MISPETSLTLALVMVFGSVLTYTYTDTAFAIDMQNAPVSQDTIIAGLSDGDGDEDQGGTNDDQEDDPVTQETITVGGKPEDNDDDNSGQGSDNNNPDDDNDDERATSDSELTNGPECPRNQERGLFTPCMPVRACSEDISVLGIPILTSQNNECVNAPLVDHPSTRD
jgi:hypothetical protein